MDRRRSSGADGGDPPVGWLLAQAGQAAQQGFRRALPEGVHPRQYAVLRLLAEVRGSDAGVSQREVADALGIPQGRLVGLLDDLEGRGWVVREASPRDRRAHVVRLTSAGLAAEKSLTATAADFEQRLVGGLSADEVCELRRLLRGLLDAREDGVGLVW